jgi:hypothetical protein
LDQTIDPFGCWNLLGTEIFEAFCPFVAVFAICNAAYLIAISCPTPHPQKRLHRHPNAPQNAS